MESAELQAHAIVKTFTQDQSVIKILDNVSYAFKQGATYAIMGMSGMGKSTFLHLIAGIDTPDSGDILFNGVSVQGFSQQQRCAFFNQSLGLAFQHPYLIRELSVLENVIIPGIVNGKSPEKCIQHGLSILKLTGLAHKANNLPGTLSGGQQQRVALARAVFNQPAFLLADEPTGSLDEATSASIVELLLLYQREWQMGIIVATHDPALANHMQHIIHIHNGQLIDNSPLQGHAKG